MRVYQSDQYTLPLPENHRFPMQKYRLLKEALIQHKILSNDQIVEAPLIEIEDLYLAHDKQYVDHIINGTLDPKEQRKIGFPWSPVMPLRSRASVGGFVAACQYALENGFAGNLSGGTHHAHRAQGGGFCVFNDFAVATHVLKQKHKITQLAIIDLDVHQGDGNASMLQGSPGVFIFSMHGEKNYPFKKIESDLDIALANQCQDDEYLTKLSEALPKVLATKPQMILYQAGVDPLFSDKLGHLALSFEGLKQRDQLVLGLCKENGIPVAIAMGGGYAEPINDSIKAHLNTYIVAKEIYSL